MASAAALGLMQGVTAYADTIYTVSQSFTVTNVPAFAGEIRGWFWMPEDRPEQKVMEFRVVEGPDSVQITRDPRYGRKWIYTVAKVRPGEQLRVVTEFKVLRRSIEGMADPSKATPITEAHRRVFAQELKMDERLTEVTQDIQKIADEVAGNESNPVRVARKMFNYIIANSDHYSVFGSMPKGLCLGSAKECLDGTGDCCTDQHALFIALCRARGIPCRLMFGSRLRPENAGKDHDPGYRCWPNFFAPGIGWVPLDISSGDAATPDLAGRWFGGLDDQRMEWSEGRDFDLEPRSSVRPDLVIRGWVEVDGKRHEGLARTVNFRGEVVPSVKVVVSTETK